MDIADLKNIREISRVTFDDKQWPHWISADPNGRRLVVDSGGYGADMIFVVNFDRPTGALLLDERFRNPGSTHAERRRRESRVARSYHPYRRPADPMPWNKFSIVGHPRTSPRNRSQREHPSRSRMLEIPTLGDT